MPDKFIAMFSVAGAPFEMLDEPFDDREAARQRCEEEETLWRCRTSYFIKVAQEDDPCLN